MAPIKFTLKCPNCGGTKFRASSPKPSPSDSVICAQCGTVVDLAAEKKRLEDEVRDAVEQRLRDDQRT
jgi:transcription initiation factor TFIIIB Brf1 subunit/transcription initiation factor TFIIB